jgi:8-oxo-dGTP diphosphatase
MTRRRTRVPRAQRVAAYAVIVRGDADGGAILLSRLSEAVTPGVLWTLPGGGVDHGEDPRAAVVREIVEETGLDAEVSETAHVFSHHQPRARRDGRLVDNHAVRIVYDGWVPRDAPEPRTVEVGGSTAEAAWVPLAAVHAGTVPTVPLVRDALAAYRPVRLQRVAAYALVLRASTSARSRARRSRARCARSAAWPVRSAGWWRSTTSASSGPRRAGATRSSTGST